MQQQRGLSATAKPKKIAVLRQSRTKYLFLPGVCAGCHLPWTQLSARFWSKLCRGHTWETNGARRRRSPAPDTKVSFREGNTIYTDESVNTHCQSFERARLLELQRRRRGEERVARGDGGGAKCQRAARAPWWTRGSR